MLIFFISNVFTVIKCQFLLDKFEHLTAMGNAFMFTVGPINPLHLTLIRNTNIYQQNMKSIANGLPASHRTPL